MNLDKKVIEQLAERLENCELEAKDTTKITDDFPEMDWEDAYAIQFEIERRKIERGNLIVGLKAGLTSHAKMAQMGVDSPVFGFLADYFAVDEGTAVNTEQLIHPKIEPEIAFMLKKPLKGPGCHIGHVLAATEFVVPAIEIIDSRYRDFKFDLKSVIADNTSSSRFVVGGCTSSVEGLDLRTVGMVLEKNGKVIGTGAGAAVVGHPATSVAMLANHLGHYDREIPAGTLILSGGVTEAFAVEAGDSVTLRAQGMGSVGVSFS